jgi:hypothetical protein
VNRLSCTSGERPPIEGLVFTMDHAHVEQFLAVDHEVGTFGEAELPGFERIPFLSKEEWLDDSRPGGSGMVTAMTTEPHYGVQESHPDVVGPEPIPGSQSPTSMTGWCGSAVSSAAPAGRRREVQTMRS